MANESVYIEIKCPYFKCININKGQKPCITCEGVDPKADFSKLQFRSNAERDAYIEKHCKHFPNKCRLGKAIDNRYEE